MKKAERDEVTGAWRAKLRPMLDEGRVTQEGVAARLTVLSGRRTDQSNVSKWLKDVTPGPASIGPILHMLRDVEAGSWPGEIAGEEERATARPVGVEAGTDLEREWLVAFRAIQTSDAPGSQKMLQVDSLASFVAHVAWARAERAAERRADAVLEANKAGKERASATRSLDRDREAIRKTKARAASNGTRRDRNPK